MKFVQAKSYSKANRGVFDVSLVVIHTMEAPEKAATAENVAAWFAGPNAPKASAHYNVDSDSIVQSVAEADVAWHAGPVNGFSIGIEHAGYAKQTVEEWGDPYSVAMLERSAELVGRICRRYKIPVRRLTDADLSRGERRGLCGHVDVTNGLTGGKGHWDPGPHFPWAWYLDRVRAHVHAHEATTANALDWPIVEHVGVRWCVAPSYIAPIGIGEAEAMAKAMSCELPLPGLVDAIWQAADLKIDASKMARQHDGTPSTMASLATYNDQAARIEAAIGGRPYKLLAGTHKDIVLSGGKVGLYGWHRPDGSVVQPFFAGHASGWIDYSQGLRLCRRA